MAGSHSNRSGSGRSAGGSAAASNPQTWGPARQWDSATVQRRQVRIQNTNNRRYVGESDRGKAGYFRGATKYQSDKALAASRNRERNASQTAGRARDFMRDYGSAARYPTRPKLSTSQSPNFNSKPGGRRKAVRGAAQRKAMANISRGWSEMSRR